MCPYFQVFAGVLRNLSWKTDGPSKLALRDAGTVATLMQAAMGAQKEATLKSILSALWNLSAHCSENKAKICAIPAALEFLISTLTYKSPTRSMAVVESGGGILRNVSSHVSLKEEYRAILRKHNCFQMLLEHLQSPSLTIVSNACGTLWNLSAHSVVDQRTLWQMGAEKKLRDLVHSKHKMISLGSSATLKNLLASRPKDKEGSSNSSTTSNPDKKNHSLMKLRQHKSSAEKEGDENQLLFLASHHDSPVIRSLTADQVSDNTSLAVCLSSPQRRQTPTMEIASMLTDVTRPVVLKSATPPFRIPAMPPSKPNERMSTSHVVNETTVHADLTQSHRMHSSTISASFSLPSSKEDQMQIDKAAVHRFHNSLRRSSQPQTRLEATGDDRQFSFSAVAYGNATVQMQQHQPYAMYCEPGSTRFGASGAVSGGIPMKSVPFSTNAYGSPEKHKGDGATMAKADASQAQQRMAFRKPSGPGTPAEFKSEPSSRGSKSVTALTPLMFSRQSSMESLDSCDQYSVRSTVYSEYSQLPTGLPSPSELPDSPTNTLPPPMTAERKALITTHQQRCAFAVEERRDSEPGSVAGGSSAAAAATGFSCVSDMAPGHSRKDDVDEEKPRIFGKEEVDRPKIFGKSSERDDEERPKVYGKAADRHHGEFEPNKLSASSSLSALTIDSDIKPKHLKLPTGQSNAMGYPCGEQNVFVFTSDQHGNDVEKSDICQELQDCILAARPSPKSNDNPFKVPRAPYAAASKPSGNRAPPPAAKESGQTTPADAVGGEDEVDLRDVMQSAMPKPKAARSKANSNIRILSPHRKGTHNVSVVKPMVRDAAASTSVQKVSSEGARPTGIPSPVSQRKTTTSASTSNANVQAEEGPSERRDENVMEKSEELLQCIAMALPKPKTMRKSKSLDRKVQRRDMAVVAFTNNVESSPEKAADGATASGTVMPNYEQDEPRALLLLSCSSALMSSATTAERIKDAAMLLDSTVPAGTRTPPVAIIAPEPHSGTAATTSYIPSNSGQDIEKTDDHSTGLDSTTIADSSKREATENETNDDSLSEDNYSQIYDESFNVVPEDLDVDSIKDDEWMLVGVNENMAGGCADAAFFIGNEIPSPTELLIDCETFSGIGQQLGAEASNLSNGRPKILKAAPATSEVKTVKGGRRLMQANVTAPKVPVRTTKATELRAKKTMQQSPTPKNDQGGLRAPTSGNPRSRSMSPALNSATLPLPARRPPDHNSGKTSPNGRLRHCSSSSGRQEGPSPMSIAKNGSEKIEDQASKKSPNSARKVPPPANMKPKRELGSYVKKKIESLQKRESASEEDSTTSPSLHRKTNPAGAAIENRGSPKSPRAMLKNRSESKEVGSQSNKSADGKRALVTTV